MVATGASLSVGALHWLRYRHASPITIVVLGMHRSGTSCITRMINLCGISLGARVVRANDFNKAGYWEAAEGLAINDALLAASGGAWDCPPDTLQMKTRERWKMKAFVGRLHRDGAAVWKDPRTVLTYPLWGDLLCSPVHVAVFRHPLSVAQSLCRRESMPIDQGLSLWTRYNDTLLGLSQSFSPFHWIDFDAGIDHVVERVSDVVTTVGLSMTDAAQASYEPDLRTSDAGNETRLDPKVSELYRQLVLKARSSDRPQIASAYGSR